MLLFRKVTTYTGHQDITDGSLSTTQAPPQIEQAIHTKDVTDTQYIYIYIYIADNPKISETFHRYHTQSADLTATP